MDDRFGFTLIEILIVIAVIAVLFILALLLINPTSQRKRLFDTQRKRDLNTFAGLVEDYHTNNQIYPRGEDICYDTPVRDGNNCSCHFCGLSKDTGIFSPLLNKLYCDPEHPRVEYLYQYDCSSDQPAWYRVYAKLTFNIPDGPYCNYGKNSDRDHPLEPYPSGCSVLEGGSYASPTPGGGGGGPVNTPVPTIAPTSAPPTTTPVPTYPPCPPDPAHKFCFLGTICNNCGTTAQCLQPASCNVPLLHLYSDTGCSNACQP